MTLKDGWLDEGSKIEGEIQEAIFARLKGVKETDYPWAPKKLRKHLKNAVHDQGYKDYFVEIVGSRKAVTTKSLSKTGALFKYDQLKRFLYASPPEGQYEHRLQG